MARIEEALLKLAAWAESRKQEAGQGLVEYALIISLVAIAAVTTLGLLGDGIVSAFTSITGSLG